jgi:hypothetical protein
MSTRDRLATIALLPQGGQGLFGSPTGVALISGFLLVLLGEDPLLL